MRLSDIPRLALLQLPVRCRLCRDDFRPYGRSHFSRKNGKNLSNPSQVQNAAAAVCTTLLTPVQNRKLSLEKERNGLRTFLLPELIVFESNTPPNTSH